MNKKENYLALLRGEKPERLVNQYEMFHFILAEPLLMKAIGTREEGKDTIDAWGTTIRWKKGDHAAMPYITEETKVIKDITQWKKYVHAPSLDYPEEAWQMAVDAANAVNRDEELVTAFMPCGLFEQSHFLMGFEDTLMNLLMEPESMHELYDYILDWKMEYAKLLIDHLNPDVIFFHDDWGAKDRLFMSRDTWVEFFKDRYKKLFDYVHSRGVSVVLHADSYLANIVEDMVDIGIDVWQGVLKENNLPKLQKQLNGRMILMGGIDPSVFDFADWNEDTVRNEVRRAIDASTALGGFIPCNTYGLPESIYPGVYEVITDEIDKINAGS